MMPVWQLENVSLTRAKTLVENLDLTVKPGDAWAVVGPNGAGKSTLLHMLAGLYAPAGGTVLFQGAPLFPADLQKLATRRALMVQSTPEDLALRVLDVAALGLSPHTGGAFLSPRDEEKVRSVLSEVGMDAFWNTPYTALSGGEKRRVMLARALLQSHDVLLLDEPTAAFDPAQILHFHQMLRELTARRNTTVVMVTHLVDTLSWFSHVLLLGHGRWAAGPCLETLQAHGATFLGVALVFGRAPDGTTTIVARGSSGAPTEGTS